MIAEILSVGTELLLGQIVNTDAQYLSAQLPALGIHVYRHTVVGDNAARLKTAIGEALVRADILITTGGLGPTQDDLTKQTIADYFGLELELHEPTRVLLEGFFTGNGRKMTENNMRQAYFPKGSHVLRNDRGTAPGCAIEAGGKVVIILPGPPRELTWMYENVVEDYLRQFTGVRLYNRVLRFYGIGESELEARLEDIIAGQSNPTIAPYAGSGEVTLRLTASAPDEREAAKLLDGAQAAIMERVGEYLYTDTYASMAETVVRLMQERGYTLSLAESCTGGMLASMLVDIPGSSEVLNLGVVSYSNQAKMDMLGVAGATLEAHGAVSEQTAGEMARGALMRGRSDFALSTTGIAGPGGGSEEKPVGLVYIALAGRDGETVQRRVFSRERNYVRHSACLAALDMLRRAAME